MNTSCDISLYKNKLIIIFYNIFFSRCRSKLALSEGQSFDTCICPKTSTFNYYKTALDLKLNCKRKALLRCTRALLHFHL